MPCFRPAARLRLQRITKWQQRAAAFLPLAQKPVAGRLTRPRRVRNDKNLAFWNGLSGATKGGSLS